MNHQLRKMETPHNQTTHNKHYQKLNLENLKWIMNSKKTTLKKHRMESS